MHWLVLLLVYDGYCIHVQDVDEKKNRGGDLKNNEAASMLASLGEAKVWPNPVLHTVYTWLAISAPHGYVHHRVAACISFHPRQFSINSNPSIHRPSRLAHARAHIPLPFPSTRACAHTHTGRAHTHLGCALPHTLVSLLSWVHVVSSALPTAPELWPMVAMHARPVRWAL